MISVCWIVIRNVPCKGQCRKCSSMPNAMQNLTVEIGLVWLKFFCTYLYCKFCWQAQFKLALRLLRWTSSYSFWQPFLLQMFFIFPNFPHYRVPSFPMPFPIWRVQNFHSITSRRKLFYRYSLWKWPVSNSFASCFAQTASMRLWLQWMELQLFAWTLMKILK